MESATENLSFTDTPSTEHDKASSGWHFLWFFYHLAVVYFLARLCAPWLAGFIRARLLPLLQLTTTSSGQLEFFFSHLFIFSVVLGFLVGLLNGRPEQRMAEFVWIVPSAILAYKLLTFSTVGSALQSQSSSAFHHYFGGGFLIPEYRDWRDFWRIAESNPDVIRGLAQATVTAPFYDSGDVFGANGKAQGMVLDMEAVGHKAIPATQSQGNVFGGSFSPDTKWVAYVSDETGRLEVYVTSFPNHIGKWQLSTGGADGALGTIWTGTGAATEVIFRDLQSHLISVPVREERGSLSPGAPRVLLGGRSLASSRFTDLTRDGKRILVGLPQENASTPLTLLLN
jgi:WD40-like Beta Propeller Repeat